MLDAFSDSYDDDALVKPVAVLFHPNVDYGIAKRQVCSVILDGEASGARSAYSLLQSLAVQSDDTFTEQRNILVHGQISEAFVTARRFFEAWIAKKPQKVSNANPFELDETDRQTADMLYALLRTPEKDETHQAPPLDESVLPWIRAKNNIRLLGVSPKDVFNYFLERQIFPDKLVGSTSTELRLAFANAPMTVPPRHYEEVDLRPQQAWFFTEVLARPDLMI